MTASSNILTAFIKKNFPKNNYEFYVKMVFELPSFMGNLAIPYNTMTWSYIRIAPII